MGKGEQVSLEAIIQTEIKSSCQQGEANKGRGRKDWAEERLRKGGPHCQMAEAAGRTDRKAGVTGWWGSSRQKRVRVFGPERKGKLLARRSGPLTCLQESREEKQR